MYNVYEIITKLKGTPGLNDKRSILRAEADNKDFQRVLTLALDPRITFGIKKIPSYDYVAQDLSLDEALTSLSRFIIRDLSGNNARDYLQGMLETLTVEDAQIIKWIIAKDFKAGFGISLINDEMNGFKIYEVPYMGAVSYNEKRIKDIMTKGPAFSEVKMDGRYLNCVVRDGSSVFMESRGGKPNPLMGCLVDEAIMLAKYMGYTDVVFNGELMLKGETDRYKSNGTISSFVSIAQKSHDGANVTKEITKFEKEQGMSIDEAKERIQLVVWDYLPYENYLEQIWTEPRSSRLAKLKIGCEETESFQIVEYKVVETVAEAITHFQEMLARGEEGTILKAWDGIWENKKPVYQAKMKLEINVDLRITGFNYGTPGTKNENVISSINVESMCGELNTSPGGIKEVDMQYITDNMDTLLGSIVETKCCGTSQDSDGVWSLLHPVFLKIRDDKNTGDDLTSILEIENMAKGLSNLSAS